MKFLFILIISTFALTGLAKNVKDFNKVLIDDVQKDIKKENVYEFKEKTEVKREPASVDAADSEPVPKQEKQNQFGPNKW